MALQEEARDLSALILDATSKNDVNSLKELLENMKIPVRKYINETTALHVSARNGQTETTSILLSHGWHPDLRDKYKQTALHVSMTPETALMLLDAKADPSVESEKGDTPLDVAITEGRAGLAELLLDRSPAPVVKNAIHIAAMHSCKRLLELMANRGYDLNFHSPKFSNTAPLHVVASVCADGDVTTLLDLGVEVDPLDGQGASPLHWAALKGNLKSVQALVVAGARVDRVDTKMGGTPLTAAIQSLNVDVVKFLIGKGANVHRKAGGGRTMLHLAAQNGNPQIVEYLIKAGLDANVLDERGGTAARWAAENGHIETLEILSSFGCDLLRPDTRNWTPLHAAVFGGQIAAVTYLIDLGASPNAISADNFTPLIVAIRGKHSEILGLLLDRGGDPSVSLIKMAILEDDKASVKQIISRLDRLPALAESFRENGTADLELAVQNKRYEIARMLVNAGCKTDKLDAEYREDLLLSSVRHGFQDVVKKIELSSLDHDMKTKTSLMTPVHIAAELGDVGMLRLLIDCGFSVIGESEYGQTALHFAACRGHTPVVRMLSGTINVLLKDVNGRTALHWAAINGHPDVVRLLSRTPGALNALDHEKHTPLHLACENGQVDCIQPLLEAGSDPSAKDFLMRTPLHFAARLKSAESVEIVRVIAIQDGVDIDARNIWGATPLGYAASVGSLEVVKWLVARSADTRVKDERGRSPLHIAMVTGHVNVIRFLLGLEPTIAEDPGTVAELWYCASLSGKMGPFEVLAQTTSMEMLKTQQVIEILTETVGSADDDTCAALLDLISRSGHLIVRGVAIRALMIAAKRGLIESSRKLAVLEGVREISHLHSTPVQVASMSKNKDLAMMLINAGFPVPDKAFFARCAEIEEQDAKSSRRGEQRSDGSESD